MKNNQLSLKGTLAWLICVAFYLYEFLLRTILGTFQQPIMYDLALSPFDFALLSSTAYLLVYGLMQMPVGTIITRFGLKKAMLFSALVCTLATFGFSCSHTQSTALLFRALMGLGSAFGFIGVLVAVYDWMPYKNIALFIGLSQFLGTLGPMAAAGPLNSLAHSALITWRSCFISLSLIGCALILLIAFFVQSNTQNDKPFILLKNPSQIKNSIFSLLKERQMWFIISADALLYFSLEYLSENEGKHLLQAKGFSSSFSSYMITLAWFGFALGSPLFGYLSDKINRRKPVHTYSAFSTLLSIFAIIYIPLTKISAIFVFFLYGLGIGASSIGIAIMAEQFKFDHISAGLGIKNSVTILFVSLMAPFISYLLSLAAQGYVYFLGDFQRVFLLLVAFHLSAFIIILFKVNETFGRSSKEAVILNYKDLPTE